MLSAVVSASACRKSISCWPIATSWCDGLQMEAHLLQRVLDVAARVLAEVDRGHIEVAGATSCGSTIGFAVGPRLKRKNSASMPDLIV